MSNTTTSKDMLPLTPVTLHILLALRERSRHGYDILQEVKRLAGNNITLSTNTLYNGINKLLRARLIMAVSKEAALINSPTKKSIPSDDNALPPIFSTPEQDTKQPDKTDSPQLTRYYHITGLGQRTLEAEFQRMDEVARAAKQKPALEGLTSIWGDAL